MPKMCSQCRVIKDLSDFHKATANKDGMTGQCKECRCLYTREYKSLHSQEVKRGKLLWQRNNREKLNEKERERYHKDVEKSREISRKLKSKHKIRKSIRGKEYRSENTDRIREWQRNYDKNHPEKAIEKQHRRRVRKKNGFVEYFSNKEIFERDNWVCQLCFAKVNKELKFPHPLSPSMDHIIPISKGGTHERKNVQLSHLICNQMAGIKEILSCKEHRGDG